MLLVRLGSLGRYCEKDYLLVMAFAASGRSTAVGCIEAKNTLKTAGVVRRLRLRFQADFESRLDELEDMELFGFRQRLDDLFKMARRLFNKIKLNDDLEVMIVENPVVRMDIFFALLILWMRKLDGDLYAMASLKTMTAEMQRNYNDAVRVLNAKVEVDNAGLRDKAERLYVDIGSRKRRRRKVKQYVGDRGLDLYVYMKFLDGHQFQWMRKAYDAYSQMYVLFLFRFFIIFCVCFFFWYMFAF